MDKKWWHHLTAYQIYTRSFCDSNGDGIGDFQGIISKLDYLQELGVGAIWISPFNDSPNYDNGYDISDYYAILKDFGTTEDLEELVKECEKRDIIVMMDLVLNHSSNEHPWFLEAAKDRDGKYHDYYIWEEGTEDQPPQGEGAFFGGNVWEWTPQIQEYYYHTFSIQQPDLNWKNEDMRKDLYAMIRYWMEKGIRGFRMDAIDNIVKNGHGGNDQQSEKIHTYLQEMNKYSFGLQDNLLTVGETGGTTLEMAKVYSDPERKELDMVFQFEHVENGNGDYGKWTTEKYDFKEFKNIMIKWQEELAGKAWNSLFLGNHDQPRSVSRFGNDNPAYRDISAKMLATCLHMMQGTPYVYQGEELGMTNVYFDKLEDYRDIESLHYFTELTETGRLTPEYMMKCLMLRSRDNARTPMQWDTSASAGFTTGEPWIKVNPNYRQINAADQLKDPDSVFHYYQKLIRLRKEMDIIVYGEFEALYRDHDQIFAYTRKLGSEKLLTVCNFSAQEAEMELPETFTEGAQCLITNMGRKVFDRKIILNPYEAFVLYKK